MRKYTKRIIAPMVFCLFLAGSICTAYGLAAQHVTNNFETGGVNIELNQYMDTGTEVKPFAEVRDITPGQVISMIPRITNYAEPCYVRASVHIDMEKTNEDEPIALNNCYGISDQWIQAGDYLYYKEPLPSDNMVDLFKGIQIPATWINETASNFKINITAEAIQAKNFKPDFSEENPWGSISIEKSKVSDGYSVNTAVKDKNNGISIVYGSGVSNFVFGTKDFFENFNKIMPGDIYTDTMHFRNDSKKEVEIFFKTSYKDSDLLNKMKLTIQSGDTVFYKGSLASVELKEYKRLVRMKADEKSDVTFQVEMPKELKNSYQEMKDKVTWWFMAKDINGTAVQTSDNHNIWIYAIVFYISGLILLITSRKRAAKERKHK